MSGKRITRVTMHGFRAIPGTMTLDLTTSSSNANSCLLLGDNGTGKSSIVDAIEFAVQGKSPNRTFTQLVNLATLPNEGCWVEVELGDGVKHRRALIEGRRERTMKSVPKQPIEEFDAAAFVLRREDIVGFMRMPADSRPRVFAAFLRNIAVKVAGERQADEEKIGVIRGRMTSLTEHHRGIVAQLAASLGMNEEHVPVFNPAALDAIFARRGLSQSINQKLGRRRRLSANESELQKLRREYRSDAAQSARLSDQLRVAQKAQRIGHLLGLMGRLESSISQSFMKLSPSAPFLQGIRVTLDELDSAFQFKAELADGRSFAIERYLSEANLDLMALLVYFALLQEAALHGQPKVLVLDDVLQSVDSVVRINVADHILNSFRGWQLIITFHDRLWREQFRNLCAQRGHPVVIRDIIRWTYESGPVVVQPGSDASADLCGVLDSASPSLIASQAGLLLETMSDWLSKSLGTSVTRRFDDKYTLADTFSGVQSTLTKFGVTEIARVQSFSILRNLVGAHYNEYAQDVSLADAVAFAKSTLELWAAVWCPTCRTTLIRNDKRLACRCGALVIVKDS